MFTPITQLWRKNSALLNVLMVLALGIMSLYPIYRNYYYGRAVEQYQRHIDFLEVNSRFHNPWQYRVFTPLTVEGLKQLYDHTIDKIIPIERFVKADVPDNAAPNERMQQMIGQLNNADFIKYNLVYSFYRFVLNLLIYICLFSLLSYFLKSNWLAYLGVIIASYMLGNAVNDSDLTLHTYLDVILYLLAGLVILNKKSGWYIVLITIIGVTNRETCLMIPFLYLISNINWQKWKNQRFNPVKFPWPSLKTMLITAISGISFIIIFVAIRWYYGYESQTEWKVPAGLPMLKLNLMSAIGVKSYFEMISVFSILPFICIYHLRKTANILKTWFIGIAPIWFLVHWVSVVAYQPRLFLVPTLLIFLPIVLLVIDEELNSLRPKKTHI